MTFTNIESVTNVRGSTILFTSTEDAGANREIPPQRTSSRNCRVPWCTSQSEFPSRHIAIIDADADRVLFYIWQRTEPDGDFVRTSPTGFQEPGPPIAGVPASGGKNRNLWVDASGITLNET
jgi:hypothetical protein